MPWPGILLICVGVLVAGFFFAVFDTTVAGIAGGRMHNIGLMQERQLGCIAGMVIAVVGVIVLVASNRHH